MSVLAPLVHVFEVNSSVVGPVCSVHMGLFHVPATLSVVLAHVSLHVVSEQLPLSVELFGVGLVLSKLGPAHELVSLAFDTRIDVLLELFLFIGECF